ncbi:DUF3556 domain-containing protein [Mycolicibacterium litorale]|jgi:Transmembrane protein of unknown function (DUF3556)|uniref:DUF3556 domain-containing protein n=1 Tax=Mycolicibacterium litorale TaxID=758802 RepID=UPI00347C74C0
MGFKEPNFPPVDLQTFLDEPLRERMRVLALHWVEYGLGSPKLLHVIYALKVAVLYIVVGAIATTWSSGVGPFWDVAGWWNEPIVYQKLVLWTVLLETVGVAGSWGPLAGKFKPMTGGILFWIRPGTLRIRPWRRVPFTAGDSRTVWDVMLYLVVLGGLVVAIALPGTPSGSLSNVWPGTAAGLVNPAAVITVIVALVLLGLRDKVIFLAARSEQYLPAMIFFAALPFVDMIVALKLLMVVIWVGAGASKLGLHFSNVVPPMVSNSPTVLSKAIKRAHYRDFPRDLRPSKLAHFMAHVCGSVVELLTPIVLLFSTNRTLTLAAVVLMVIFHLFIIAMFPLAVPLEWNVLFAYATVFLFWGFPNWQGFGIGDMSSGWLIAAIAVALLFFPILGNVRPDLVSFLPSMRQYAGNWASALWAFAPGAEQKLNAVKRPTGNQIDQLKSLGYDDAVAEITMQQTIAWRSMHSQGRGLFSLLYKYIPDIDRWTIREAEFACNSLLGFNFGDGHMHDEEMLTALQKRCGFEPGEFLVVWVESQAIQSKIQRYKVIDVALGVIERGTWRVADAVDAQPWLPNGPIPHQVEWRMGRQESQAQT